MPRRPHPKDRAAHLRAELLATQLRAAQLKLKQLEARIGPSKYDYVRYEDLPPPSPAEQLRFIRKFERLYGEVCDADHPAESFIQYADGDGPENYDWGQETPADDASPDDTSR